MNQQPSITGTRESPARLLLRLPLCDKTATTEFSHDFTLPDYLPEIRKMLRVTVRILPPEGYASAADAEYAGKLCYDVLYTGADGLLHAAALPAEYAFSAPFEASETCDLSMGVDAWADCTPELLVTRVLSPRKLGIRCRLRSHARAYGWHSLEETLSGNARGRIERLTGETDSAVILRGSTDAIEVSDEILDGGSANADALRVIAGEGHVFISEAIPEKDRVNLRGEVILKILSAHDALPVSGEEEETERTAPTVTQRKIPFAVSVDVEGADRYCDARGFGTLSRLALSTEDGRIVTDAELTLTAECQKNHRFAYTRDLFSTGAECETVHSTAALPFALRAENANFTLSDSVPLEGSGIGAGDRILDATGDLTPESVTEAAGKTVFSGNARFHILTENKESGEYGFGEITLPFRYTAEGAGDAKDLPAVTDYDAFFEPVTVRVKSDGERLAVDAEIAVSYRTAGKREIALLESAAFGEPLKKARGAIVIAYPAPGETLWDTAERYHTAVETLATQNGMEPIPDTRLNGVKYLVVEE